MEPLQHIIDTYRHRKSRSYALIERMLRTYLRPYLWLLGLSVLANVVVAGTTSALPWFIQQAIDKVSCTLSNTFSITTSVRICQLVY